MTGISNNESGLTARAKINAIIAREFDTPADIFADTTLTLTPNDAESVTVGDTIKSREGGHCYSVLAADASVYDFATAGGVKLNLLPSVDGVYHFDGMNPTKDGTGDNLAKFQTLLNKTTIVGVGARVGPEIVVGYGTYAFSDTINLKSLVRLVFKRATCVFPAATAGIIVNRFNTFGATTDSSDPYGADNSEIIGFRMSGGRGDEFDETKSGIWLRARAIIYDAAFSNLAGHGIYAAAGSDGNPYLGNCNLSRVRKIDASGCRGSACHIEGTDANAGTFDDINGVSNDQWCVYEDSFLGNTHRGHHSYANLLGCYYGGNQSIFEGCYAEDGVGGVANTGGPLVACAITAANAGTGPKIVCEHANGPRSWTNENGGFRGRSSVHSADVGTEGNMIVTSRHSIEGIGYPFRLGWEDDATGAFIRWASSNTRLLNFHGRNTAATYGRSAAVGESLNIPSFFLGSGSGARALTYSSAAPTTGTWARGDIVFNNAPSAAGKIGWVCTTAGTPGTWKAWGVIDA